MDIGAIYAWLLTRAFVYIALVSVLLKIGTRNDKIVLAYCVAHAAALVAGSAVDFTLYKLVFHSEPSVQFFNWAYAAPIFLFTAISLYICHWEGPLHLPDVLLPLGAVVVWACLIIWGPQDMEGYDVIGAWFVSAGTGGVDLFTLHGPPWARERRVAARLAGYAAVVAAVYLALPRA
jgi:hypothetical protein